MENMEMYFDGIILKINSVQKELEKQNVLKALELVHNYYGGNYTDFIDDYENLKHFINTFEFEKDSKI